MGDIFLLLISIVLSGVFFYFQHLESLEIAGYLNNPSPDFNYERMVGLFNTYKTVGLFIKFYKISDEYMILIMVLLLWLGVFPAVDMYRHRAEGYGNYLISRCGLNMYYKNVIISRSVYIVTVLFLLTICRFGLALFAGGTDYLFYEVNDVKIGLFYCVIFALLTWIVESFFCVCINIITMGLSCFISNIYIYQVLPFLVFFLLPYLCASTIGNIINLPQHIWSIVVPFDYLNIVMRVIMDFEDKWIMIDFCVSVIIFLMAAIIAAIMGYKKLGENYL